MSDLVYAPAGPVTKAFHASDAFIRGIMGPIGSGKSVACCMEIARRAFRQQPAPDGVRRTRWAVIRNSYPELKSTTINTWADWFKPELFGPLRWDPPIKHQCKLAHDVELEVLFLALDRPEDIKKLLSLEVTGVWLNEARELPKAILDGASGRVGRYPSMRDGGATWAGVIMDTNAPDEDHWWAKMAERPDLESLGELERKLTELGALAPGQPVIQFFRQPSGLSDDAENLANLRGGQAYYLLSSAGKSQDWIDVYVHGKYGNIADGRPVYPEFNPDIHVAKEALRPDPQLPLVLGWDFGLTPACAVTQFSRYGQFRLLDEVVGDDLALSQFATNYVKPLLNGKYHNYKIISIIDPAGTERNQARGDTCRDVLRSMGLSPSAAFSNLFNARRESVVQYLTRLVDGGKPGFIMDPSCRIARKGMAGQYKFKRVQVPGEERFKDVPDKNLVSHICEALQYASMRGGRPFRPDRKAPPKQRYHAASQAGY